MFVSKLAVGEEADSARAGDVTVALASTVAAAAEHLHAAAPLLALAAIIAHPVPAVPRTLHALD